MFLCNNFVSVAFLLLLLIGFCLTHVTGAGPVPVLVIVIGSNYIFRADANQSQIDGSSDSNSTSNTTRAVGELCNITEDCSGDLDICLYIPKPGASIANAPPGHPECYDCNTGGISGLPECQDLLDHRLRNYLLLAAGVVLFLIIVAAVLFCCFCIRSCPGYRCRTGRGRRGRRRGRRGGGGGRHNHSHGTGNRSRTVQTQSSRSGIPSSSQQYNEGGSQTKSTSNTKLSAKGKKKGKLKNKSKRTTKSAKSKRSSKKSKKSGKTKKTKKSKLGKGRKVKRLKNNDESNEI